MNDAGTSVLELALVVSILMVILFGIIQFGITFHVYQGMSSASAEGARLAALPESTSAEVESRVRTNLSGIDPSLESCPPSAAGEFCITVTPSDDQPCSLRRGQEVTVEVARLTRIDVPLWAAPELTLTARGVYRCEG